MTIVESNKLIAEFMGAREMTFKEGTKGHSFWNTPFEGFRAFPNGSSNYYNYEDEGYHKSWDWLMSVVEKIESMDHTYVNISKSKASIHPYIYDIEKDAIQHHPPITILNTGSKSKLEIVYEVVVEFIKKHPTLAQQIK